MIRFTQKYFRAYKLEVQSIEDRPHPSEPTEHSCGSTAKIETMRGRCDRGESVFHPLDAREIISRNNNDVVPAIKQRLESHAEDRRQAEGSKAIRVETESAYRKENWEYPQWKNCPVLNLSGKLCPGWISR